jgi:gamma-glutamyl-gamma-aminobutyrate hydrolase PuuD
MAASKIVAITIFTVNRYMKIGLSKSIIHHEGFVYDAIDQGWYNTLKGHNLFVIPNTLNQDFNVMANDLDSLILSGGGYSEQRREVEKILINKMVERNKPVVGIASGAFEIAESIGGELECIEKQFDINHPIFYHREVLEVNSHHHGKCIKSLPNSANVLCLDYLGNIEAFTCGNLAGIVWNPEKMDKPWIPPEIAFMLRI